MSGYTLYQHILVVVQSAISRAALSTPTPPLSPLCRAESWCNWGVCLNRHYSKCCELPLQRWPSIHHQWHWGERERERENKTKKRDIEIELSQVLKCASAWGSVGGNDKANDSSMLDHSSSFKALPAPHFMQPCIFLTHIMMKGYLHVEGIL